MPTGGTNLGSATDGRVVGTLDPTDYLYARSNGASPFTEYVVYCDSVYDDALEIDALYLRLWKRVSSSSGSGISGGTGWTYLGGYGTGVLWSGTIGVTLECVGTAVKVYTGGVARISVTDSAISGPGYYGHIGATSTSFTSLDAGYDVTLSAGNGGSVDPASLSGVDAQTGKPFTVTPDAGYVIASVSGSSGLTVTPNASGQKSATQFTVKATQDGTVTITFASLTPTIGTVTCDMHGGVSIPVTEGHSSTTGYKAFWCATSGGTYAELLKSVSGVTGSITAASKLLTVNDASALLPGDQITIAGAEALGGNLSTQIVTIAGSVVTIGNPAGTTVSSAAVTVGERPLFGATEGTGGAWTVHVPRPDHFVAWGQTLYIKLKATHPEGDSAFSSVASVTLAQNTQAVLAAIAAEVVERALGQQGYIEHAEALPSYSSWPLMPRAVAYYLDPSAQNLSLIEAQFDHLCTFEDANGIVPQIDPSYILADSHYRACWHSYVAAKLLEVKGESTLSAAIRAKVDAWAVNYLTYAKLIRKTYNNVTFTSFAVNTLGTWIGSDAGNQDLWGCMVLAHLYNDPTSALYHSTATYESRTTNDGPYTILQLIEQTLSGVAACQWTTTSEAGYIPWQYGTQPVEGEDLYTGYHMASHISLLGIQAAFGEGWSSTLDTMLDNSYSYMTTAVKWVYENHPDFEGTDERGVAFYATTGYTDPVPGLNYSWSRYNYETGHRGDYGRYQAINDFTTLRVYNGEHTAYIDGYYTSIDSLLSATAIATMLWFVAPQSLTATLHGDHADLSWPQVVCDGYYVERQVDGGTWAAEATIVGAATTTHADVDLPASWTTIAYRVAAYRGSSTTAWTRSNTILSPVNGMVDVYITLVNTLSGGKAVAEGAAADTITLIQTVGGHRIIEEGAVADGITLTDTVLGGCIAYLEDAVADTLTLAQSVFGVIAQGTPIKSGAITVAITLTQSVGGINNQEAWLHRHPSESTWTERTPVSSIWTERTPVPATWTERTN